MLWIMRGVRSCLISGRICIDCDNCIQIPILHLYAQNQAYALLALNTTMRDEFGQEGNCHSASKFRTNAYKSELSRLSFFSEPSKIVHPWAPRSSSNVSTIRTVHSRCFSKSPFQSSAARRWALWVPMEAGKRPW